MTITLFINPIKLIREKPIIVIFHFLFLGIVNAKTVIREKKTNKAFKGL
jgi:hypothetical protein